MSMREEGARDNRRNAQAGALCISASWLAKMNLNQLTGNIGLFYACYQLSLRGWNALPTIRNAKGADVIGVKGKRKLGIQVKALSKPNAVPLGRGALDESVDFWVVIINVRDDIKREVFVIPQKDILRGLQECSQDNVYKDFVSRSKDNEGGFTYWLGHNFLASGQHNYTDAWEYLEDE